MPASRCLVSFTDGAGVRHQAEVTAESLYEAAVLALKAFGTSSWTEGPKPASRLCIEVLGPVVRHELSVAQVRAWLESNSPSPNEQARKRKLRDLLTAG
jgi:hypothetical protein